MTTPILTDDLTEQESQELVSEQRDIARVRRLCPIPFAGEADPRLIVPGDMIGIYAGNEVPSHAATVETVEFDDHFRYATYQTTDGEYVVPYGMRVWVAAYAPLLGD